MLGSRHLFAFFHLLALNSGWWRALSCARVLLLSHITQRKPLIASLRSAMMDLYFVFLEILTIVDIKTYIVLRVPDFLVRSDSSR